MVHEIVFGGVKFVGRCIMMSVSCLVFGVCFCTVTEGILCFVEFRLLFRLASSHAKWILSDNL